MSLFDGWNSDNVAVRVKFDLPPFRRQKAIQAMAREFAQDVLDPISRTIDEEPDPLRAFQLAKPAYREAFKRGITFSMLPSEFGGGGLSNVDFVIAAEEI
jgi:acyl-CoA dehydrogenase